MKITLINHPFHFPHNSFLSLSQCLGVNDHLDYKS